VHVVCEITIGGLHFRLEDQKEARNRRWPELESLVVDECKFDTASNRGEQNNIDGMINGPYGYEKAKKDIDEIEPINGRYKTCPLHVMLRTAPNLKYLKIVCDSKMVEGPRIGKQTQPPPNTRVELPNVTRLIVPPVSVWTVDIRAPNVESLDFMLADDVLRNTNHYRPQPLIPTVEESPVDINNLTKITHLGFETVFSDTVDRLEAWLLRAHNLTSLSIHGNKGEPLGPGPGPAHLWPVNDPRHREQPVSVSLLHTLILFSERLPKLDTLQITQCDLADEHIVNFIKMRKESPGTSAVVKLSLIGRDYLSPETHAWLHEAVKLPNGKTGFSHDTSRMGTYWKPQGVCDLCEF
jgi:hypothetical protein